MSRRLNELGTALISPWLCLGAVLSHPIATTLKAAEFPIAAVTLHDALAEGWGQLSNSNAPSKRYFHKALWTGSNLLVWGGIGFISPLDPGGRYNPTSNTWSPMTFVGAPPREFGDAAVWTGSEMLVWTYSNNFGGTVNVGAAYDPRLNTWTPISTTNAPTPRSHAAYVWTGSELIVWGGESESATSSSVLADGGRYNPVSNTWTPMQTNGAPSARGRFVVAAWTGSEVIIWGGASADATINRTDGGRYNPATDSWTPISTNGIPPPTRTNGSPFKALWTGKEMIVCNYASQLAPPVIGGIYNAAADTWRPMSTNGAPSGLLLGGGCVAVWTGSEMIVWGGANPYLSAFYNEGGRYNPETDTWSPLPLAGAPPPGTWSAGAWTGSQLLVFSGRGPAQSNYLHAYTPPYHRVALSFPSEPNFSYRLQQRSNWETSPWLDTGDSVAGTGTVLTLTNSVAPGVPARFYRVLGVSPPAP